MGYYDLRAPEVWQRARGQYQARVAGTGVFEGSLTVNEGDIGRLRVGQAGGAANQDVRGADEGALEKRGDLTSGDG
jgi:hypothetical protein